MDPDLEGTERSPQQIELEIERTRDRMSNHIEELENRLRPENLKAQAKEAIAEKAQVVVSNARHKARETGFRLKDLVTRHPLPVAAASIGAIALVALSRRRRSAVSAELGSGKHALAGMAKGGFGVRHRNPLAVAAVAVIGLAIRRAAARRRA
jgi:hypothetical protein